MKLNDGFRNLFYNNNEWNHFVVIGNLKEDANIIQQKRWPITIHLQKQVAEELKILIKNGYLDRATEKTEDCFVNPAVMTVRKMNY